MSTHTDTDHIGDLESVAKVFGIGEILVSPGSLTKVSFVRRLRQLNTRVKTVTANDQIALSGTQLEILYPFEKGDGSNNDSVVVYTKWLGQRFLFTGDLEKEGEDRLRQAYPQLKVDILKAGHHGSKGSSSPEFLRQLSPKLTLISAGKDNRYHHPHRETLERLDAISSQVYRTDRQGAIRLTGFFNWKIETVR